MSRFTPNAYTVPANKRDEANAALAAHGLGGMFSLPLVPTTRANREPPATHYACAGNLSAVQVNRIKTVLDEAGIAFVRSQPEAGKSAFERALEKSGTSRAKEETTA